MIQDLWPLQKRVYRSKAVPGWAFLFVFVFYVLFVYNSFTVFIDTSASIIVKVQSIFYLTLYIFIFAAILMVQMMRKLEVSAEGITYYNVGFCMYVPWHMVQGRGQAKYPCFPFRAVDVLVLRQTALLDRSVEEGKRLGVAVIEERWGARWKVLWPADPKKYVWCVPIPEVLMRGEKRVEFEATVQYYAPVVIDYRFY